MDLRSFFPRRFAVKQPLSAALPGTKLRVSPGGSIHQRSHSHSRLGILGGLSCVLFELFGGGAVPSTKTFMATPGQVEKSWFTVDATDQLVGRLASDIAVILMGKHRPTYTPHVDTGDFVIVTNVSKIAFTGKKWDQKLYTWYTGYPGQKSITARKRFEKSPELILREAVRRMLPKNKLGRKMLSKLKLYTGTDHPHACQQPEAIELGKKIEASD